MEKQPNGYPRGLMTLTSAHLVFNKNMHQTFVLSIYVTFLRYFGHCLFGTGTQAKVVCPVRAY